jgi:translation initiation factor IF-2
MKMRSPILRTGVFVATGFLLPMSLSAAESTSPNGQMGARGDRAISAENWGQTRPRPPDERAQYDSDREPGSASPGQGAYGAWRAYPDERSSSEHEGVSPPSARSSEEGMYQWASPGPSQGGKDARPERADQGSSDAPGAYQPMRDPWAATAPRGDEEQPGARDSATPATETEQPQPAQGPPGGTYPGYAGRPLAGGPGAPPPAYGAYPGPVPPPGAGAMPPPGAGYGGWGGPPGAYGGPGYGPPGPYGGPPRGGNSSNMPWGDWMPWSSGSGGMPWSSGSGGMPWSSGRGGGTPWGDWMPWSNR